MKLAKDQTNATQHPELNFWHLKFIRIIHPRYQPRITGHVLKNNQKNKCICIHEIIRLIIMKMKMKMKKKFHVNTTSIDVDRNMDTNIVNIKSVSAWWCLYVLRSTLATFEAQFMKKLSIIEPELKKLLLIKKVCIN